MKAIVLSQYGSPSDLRLEEVEKPVPKDDEVLIRVHAAAVNDWDWGMVRGNPFYIRLLCGFLKPRIRIPGVDIAGRVEEVGKNVSKLQPGDAVYGDLSDCGFGAFAEYVCAPEKALTLKPDAMTFAEAAALPHAAALAMQGLKDVGQLQSGQKVLINGGGGGVGTLGVQIAKSMGAEVDGVDHAGKFEMMKDAGFDHVIDYTKEDFTQSDRRYDLILDTKTLRSPARFSRVLNPGGTYATVGGATSRLLQTALMGPLIGKSDNKTIRVVALKANKDLAYVNTLFEAGKLKPVIDGPFDLSEVPRAIQLFGEGRHKGKVIINIDSEDGI